MDDKKYYEDFFAKGRAFNKSLNNECYSVNSSGQTYRTIDVWSKAGLFDDLKLIDKHTTDKQEWKKFSMLDLIWIEIISQLRKFGLSLVTIKALKSSLRCYAGNLKNLKWAYESKVREVFQGAQIVIIVQSNGEAEIHDYLEWEYIKRKYKINNFIIVNFTEIVKSLNKNVKIVTKHSLVVSEPSKEFEILQLIKNGNYESVEIVPKNGVIERYRLNQKVDVNKRIIDILKEADYQNITINRTNGVIVSIKQSIQHK